MIPYWNTETYCDLIWIQAGKINNWKVREINRKRNPKIKKRMKLEKSVFAVTLLNISDIIQEINDIKSYLKEV